MDNEELAKERFCAQEAVLLGISQCMDCKHSERLSCKIMSEDDSEPYSFNELDCPHRVLRK